MKLPALIAAIFMTISSHSPQQPSGGRIEGIVVQSGSGQPVAEASVTAQLTIPPRPGPNVSSPQPPLPQTVFTDALGKFVVKDLDAGPYRVFVSADGFVRQELKAPVNVTTGQTVRDVRVSLIAAGNVNGRVRDLDGKPIAGVPVQILKPVYNFRGERTMQSVGAASTDDRGEYRVYWVTPGHYYVLAGTAVSSARGRLTGASPNLVPGYSVLPTYYPNAPDLSGATTIDVQSGVDLDAIDFVVERMQARRIRGRVVDAATGRWPASANIKLVTRPALGGTHSIGSPRSYNAADGTFELSDVSPGLHQIIVEVTSPGTPAPARNIPIVPAGAGRVGIFVGDTGPRELVTAGGQLTVLVGKSDIEDLVITLGAAMSISGRLVVEGSSTPSGVDRLRVQLTPSSSGVMISYIQSPALAAATPNGTFKLENVLPGEYRVQLAGLQSDFYMKEARFGTQDVLNKPLNFSPSAEGTLDIIVGTRVSKIDGTVTDEKSRPVPGIPAVLVPDRYRDRADLFRNVTTDSNGRFQMEGVAPGDYRVFAWEAMDPFAYYDPDFVGRYEQRGQPVNVSESSSHSVQVRLIAAAPDPSFPNARAAVTRSDRASPSLRAPSADSVTPTPTGTVTGYIRTSAGKAAVGIHVRLVAPVYGPGGESRLVNAGAARANDRGEYRIYQVTPGRYYLVTSSPDLAGGSYQSIESSGFGGSPNETQSGSYGATFHPGVIDPTDADIVKVESGVELKLDLVVPREVYHVRGRVIDARSGRWPASAQLTLLPRRLWEGAPAFMRTMPLYNAADGTFEVRDVPPGLYYLSVSLQERGSPGGGSSGPIPVTVSGSDVDGVLVTVEPNVSISGRVAVDGPPPDWNRVRVSLNLSAGGRRLTDSSYGAIGGFPAVNSAGTFTLNNVMAGEYRLFVLSPPNYYVKEARYNGTDVLNNALNVSSSTPRDLAIVLSSKTGTISGTVFDSTLHPAGGVQAVLIPDENRDRSDLYKSATTDAAGRFTLKGVPPGNYKLFAWATLEQFAYYDSKVLQLFEREGTPVHVTESATATVEVKLIPPR